MQNAQIWKSIEALCNEAESVIQKNEPVLSVVQSIAPPAFAYQATSRASYAKILSSKPAPSKAKIVTKPKPKEHLIDAPLSPATMTEIAAAIDRAGQNALRPQVIEHPQQSMSDQLRKDLMIEVSLAVRSVLANELPKMVRHSISESLYELINSADSPKANNSKAPKARPRTTGGKNKLTAKNKTVQITLADLEGMSKRELKDLGREYGVELDRRYKKSTLVEKMKNII